MILGNKKKIGKKIFKIDYLSHQIRSEIFDVYFDLKKTSRIILNYDDNLKKLAKKLIKLGLFIAVSKGFILHSKNNKKFSDWFVSKGKNTKKMVCFYIAKTIELANKSREMDETRNDENFGEILGYPKCCINYVKKNGRPPTIYEAFDKYLFKNMKYNPFLWPPAMLTDSYLISHFPCKKNCKASSDLAKKKWKLLKKFTSFKIQKHFKIGLSKLYIKKKNKVFAISAKVRKKGALPQKNIC